MSLSGSSGEDEQIAIIEAQRADHSPPRKKRRLNDSRSQAQQFDDSSSESTDDNLSDCDGEEISNSDKENTLNGINRKKRRRPSTQQIVLNNNNNKRHRNGKHDYSSQQTQNIYEFGQTVYDIPIAVNPGAIVRLELINFLCHSNFAISFHPSINIIYGQNGSGKSAIEAGISMALGINAKKTGRGNRITDVIRFGCDFAMIRLFLHNQGPEALPEYGREIVIERKLSKTGKNGTSYFRVLDSNLKIKGKGLKSVRNIVDKFSMNVDNPCVVLKQSTAKEFLNSTKSTDKFKFFMQASKLGLYQEHYQEARENVITAKEQQKQTKGSFIVIRDQYFECKRQYDTLINNEKQCEKIKFWKKAEKWMKYHKERNTLKIHSNKIKETENKVIKSKKQLNNMRENMNHKLERAKTVKNEIETKTTDLHKYMLPINELKTKMSDLDKERKDAARKASSKQTFIDRSRKKIKGYQREHKNCMEQLENDENAKELAVIQETLSEAMNKLNEYRSEKEGLERKIEPTIEMKDNEQKLNAKQSELYYKKNEIEKIHDGLRGLNRGQNKRSEFFCDPRIKRKGISIDDIRRELNRYHRKFNRAPIGPLGEYIKMIPHDDKNEMNRNIQIVQSVLSSSLYVFLVDSSSDQQLFKQIMWNKWRITVPCIQYRYSDRIDVIPYNPFKNYRAKDADGPLIRVSDMFTIKDNNPWIYNAIITLCSPERVFAHGTLDVARQFVSTRSSAELRLMNSVLTYQEKNRLYSVVKRGGTVGGQPQRITNPILQSDTTQLKVWYQEELKKLENEKKFINDNIHELSVWVQQSKQQIRTFQQQFKNLNRNIKSLENKIEKLSKKKTQIEEEQEDDNEIQQHIMELSNSIEDEQSQINQLNEEIAPFQKKTNELLTEISSTKRKLHDIEQELQDKKRSAHSLKGNYNKMLESLTKEKQMIAKVPLKISEYERQLENDKKVCEDEEKRINGLYEAAKQMEGDEVTKENYPRNVSNRNRVFSLRDLKQSRCRLEAEIEEWQNAGNDADDIRQRFASIEPKYENHQNKVDAANYHVDEMNRFLHNRRKQYDKMKDQVREALSREFRIIMRQQGHDGKLIVNYDTKELEMKVHMASHDGLTQVVNSKTLSGGERSFTQVALIMALQKFSGSPMCIYDEFDVFMDSINRGNSIKILLKAALLGTGSHSHCDSKKKQKKQSTERQYIFITPNDVSPIIAQGHKNMISIHKLKPPRN